MANGGGSRIGGFIRGVLMGMVVCAIAAVALSLSAPVPERAALDAEVLGGTAAEGSDPAPSAAGAVPETATAPAADPAPSPRADPAPAAPGGETPPAAEATAEPEQEAATSGQPAAPAGEPAAPAGDSAAPQATAPQSAPAASESPAQDGDAFSAPQSPTQ